MQSTRILGTGSYLPPTVLTNHDLEKRGLDTTHDWIVQRTGVCERRIAGDGVATSDLGYEAGVKALEMAGMSAREIDLIMRDGESMVFVEVRFRQSDAFGGALESITRSKRRRLIAAANAWLQQTRCRAPARFDVVTVTGDNGAPEWIKNAFGVE